MFVIVINIFIWTIVVAPLSDFLKYSGIFIYLFINFCWRIFKLFESKLQIPYPRNKLYFVFLFTAS